MERHGACTCPQLTTLAALVTALTLLPAPARALPWGSAPRVELTGAVQRNQVQIVSALGVGNARWLNLRVRAAAPITLTISVGTYFRHAPDEDETLPPGMKLPQNLVVVKTTTTRLSPGEAKTIAVPTACANRSLRTPNAEDRYALGRAPEALSRLFTCLQSTRFPASAMQAAVWAATSPAYAKQIARQGFSEPTDLSSVCSSMRDEQTRQRCQSNNRLRQARHTAQAPQRRQALETLRRCDVISP